MNPITEKSWSHEQNTYRLAKNAEEITLYIDEAPVLHGPHEVFEQIVRHARSLLRGLPPNAGLRWTDEDDVRLAERHADGSSMSEIARDFGRTRGAIQARLIGLRLIPDNGAWRRFGAEEAKA